ncbi:MAG: hypothetical protein A2Z47_07500 [Thermodesulfovibrio sp. RBG_19FT_COMBO_42_12]|nr:MAG: hypothetical protein A2Z47_07500 [Thermodesulfovibrio sp. RBG_19FT_COMBO_42_12]
MKVLIPQIPEDGLDLELQETIESESIVAPIRARLKIEKVGAELIIKGNVIADVKFQCSRCLKDFRSALSVPVDVTYHPVEELKGEDKHEIKFEELDMDFYSGEELDLLGLLTEQIVLNLPMKPLCTDLCKGICLKCGADLNAGNCGCIAKEVDTRLEALKKLLK